MTDKKSADKRPNSDSASGMEKLFQSPAKLVIFCAALLMLSLMTGMMIGSIIKENREAGTVIADEQSENLLIRKLRMTTPSEAPLTAKPEQTDTGPKPVDALEYNAADYRDAPQGPISDEENGTTNSEEVEVAALPPAQIPSTTKELLWQKYRVSSEIAEGSPLIAVVIDDVGLNARKVQKLVALPAPLTLAFLPYANQLQSLSDLSRENGHEVMLHLPMEPSRASVDPGPDALLNALSDAEILRRTQKNLDQFEGYVGVNNHMGSKFTAYEQGMAVVMAELSARGLLFLDSRTTSESYGFKLAQKHKMLSGNRDVFIDNEIDVSAILKQLAKVETYATKNGIAIAIGHPYDQTVDALTKWIPEVKARGYQLVSVSTALIAQSQRN